MTFWPGLYIFNSMIILNQRQCVEQVLFGLRSKQTPAPQCLQLHRHQCRSRGSPAMDNLLLLSEVCGLIIFRNTDRKISVMNQYSIQIWIYPAPASLFMRRP